MPNILQVSPNPIDQTQQIQNTAHRVQNENPAIHNPADPNVVNRADGQKDNGTGTATGEQGGRILDFEGNYANFISTLSSVEDFPKAVSDLLFGDQGMILFQHQEGLETVLDQLFSSIEVDNQEELLQYLMDSRGEQMKFSGSFFDGLRGLMSENISTPLRDAIMNFVKSYNNLSAGEHLLHQMETISGDIKNMLLSSVQDKFEEILSKMDFHALPGNTEQNETVLNNELIPFLSRYVSQTHDYGPIRNAAMMLILYAVKYEDGSKENLEKMAQRLMKNGDFQLLFKGDPESSWQETAQKILNTPGEGSFPDLFSQFLQAGAQGRAGTENIGKFQQVLNGLLVNESVYMPLTHTVIPFSFQGQQVMSEMWVEPESRKRDGSNGGTKLLLKFNIQSLGNFEMVSLVKDRRVDMQLFLPKELMDQQKKVEESVSGILRSNGLSVANVGVFQRKRDIRLTEVFASLQEQNRGVNIRI